MSRARHLRSSVFVCLRISWTFRTCCRFRQISAKPMCCFQAEIRISANFCNSPQNLRETRGTTTQTTNTREISHREHCGIFADFVGQKCCGMCGVLDATRRRHALWSGPTLLTTASLTEFRQSQLESELLFLGHVRFVGCFCLFPICTIDYQ